MELIYFLVTDLTKNYADKFGMHANYFVDNGAFLEGLGYSAGIGFVCALAFYFCLCNGNSAKAATRVNWIIGLLIVALIGYFVSDTLIMGAKGSGFYQSVNDFVMEFGKKNPLDTMGIQERTAEMNMILKNLREGKDVAFELNITNTILTMLSYFITSIVVKNFTKHGSQIPF